MLLVGCTVGPDYEPPDLELPASWSERLPLESEQAGAQLQQWWTLFDDSVLEGLVEQAAQANLDAQAAMMRVVESRAARDFTAGEYSPRADAIASYSRLRDSEHTRFAFPAAPTEAWGSTKVSPSAGPWSIREGKWCWKRPSPVTALPLFWSSTMPTR